MQTLQNTTNIYPIMLNGMPLPYVNKLKHLGKILQSSNKMVKDCISTRAKFISKLHSLNQEFHYACRDKVIFVNSVYPLAFRFTFTIIN